MEKIILGIDPGTNIMGYGLLKVVDGKAKMITMENVQSMLKLGRAQGTAIAAAVNHGVPIHEYAPMKIKMALTGNGNASKEQVAGMLQRLLKIPNEDMGKFMDATDALAAAYCHYLQMGKPESPVKYRGWKDFINKNQEKVSKRKIKNEDN